MTSPTGKSIPYLSEITISGYRAISEPLTFAGLSPFVALCGDNAVGKSSVLQAVALLGMLTAVAFRELLGTGKPWPANHFYDSFQQDRVMFNTRAGGEIRLEGTWSNGFSARFRLNQRPEGISVGIESLGTPAEDLLAVFQAVRSTPLFETTLNRVNGELQSYGNIRLVPSPSIPVPDTVRATFVTALSSVDLTVRRAARQTAALFPDLFPALGPGELDALENPPLHPKDLAWVGDWAGVIPLDRLGGGVQSTFSSLAQLTLSRANIACMDETEAFVGQRALPGLASAFRAALDRRLCAQVWIATHALTLAHDYEQVFVLEQEAGVVKARRSPPAKLARFMPELSPPTPLSLGRLSDDGSVRLPPTLIKRLGLVTGDFVHYVDIDDTGARIVSPAAMEARYGKDDDA